MVAVGRGAAGFRALVRKSDAQLTEARTGGATKLRRFEQTLDKIDAEEKLQKTTHRWG